MGELSPYAQIECYILHPLPYSTLTTKKFNDRKPFVNECKSSGRQGIQKFIEQIAWRPETFGLQVFGWI